MHAIAALLQHVSGVERGTLFVQGAAGRGGAFCVQNGVATSTKGLGLDYRRFRHLISTNYRYSISKDLSQALSLLSRGWEISRNLEIQKEAIQIVVTS